MTTIERLRVAGIKSIDQIELNPNQINLITGRNNVGKTSLLESIDFLFNPGNIEHLRGNLDKIINEGSGAGSIECEYRKGQMTLDSYDNTSDTNTIHDEIGLRQPNDSEVIEYSMDIINNILEINEGYPMGVGTEVSEIEVAQTVSNIREDTEEIMSEVVAGLSEKEIISNMRDNIIILEVDGDVHPYIHLGQGYNNLRRKVVDRCIEQAIQNIQIESFSEEDTKNIRNTLSHDFRRLLAPRFGGDQFVEDDPRQIEGVTLIRDPKLNSNSTSLSEDRSAIIASDIEDFLKDSDIIDNLNDFSFNKIVYTEDNSKHEVPYEFMGDGFKSIVGCLWHLFDNRTTRNVLLLEEPDVHMHPGYVEKLVRQLIKLAKEENIQLFITTHNLDMIESFLSEPLEESHGDYLRSNFQIVQMTGKIHRELDYEQGKEEVQELNSDLRGI